jgi:lyso-ornithine lipid O-acyltransferase
MGQRLLGGDAVVLFAEGTSGDHNRVLPFRSSLIGAVRGEGLATARVQPVAIHYARLHGLPLGRRWRPGIAWYGDMELLPHLWALVRRGGIHAEVFFADAVAADGDRKLLARDAEIAIRAMIRTARIGRDPAGPILLHRETR